MLMLLTVVAAPMPHFSTSPSRLTGLFGGVPNESFKAMGCGVLPPKGLGGVVVGVADGGRGRRRRGRWGQRKRQRAATLRGCTGQHQNRLLKFLAGTKSSLNSHPRRFRRLPRLCLEKFQSTQVDSNLPGGTKPQNLLFCGYLSKPRDTVLAVDAGFLKVSNEFGQRSTGRGVKKRSGFEVLGERIVRSIFCRQQLVGCYRPWRCASQ